MPCGSVTQCFSLPRVAAGRLAFVEQGQVGGLRPALQLRELFVGVGLKAEMVDARLAAAGRDRRN
jgi:hypothetical protein